MLFLQDLALPFVYCFSSCLQDIQGRCTEAMLQSLTAAASACTVSAAEGAVHELPCAAWAAACMCSCPCWMLLLSLGTACQQEHQHFDICCGWLLALSTRRSDEAIGSSWCGWKSGCRSAKSAACC
jgi:hypothetical protein